MKRRHLRMCYTM